MRLALLLVVALTGCVVRPGAYMIPAPIHLAAAGGVAAPGGTASVSVHVSFFGVPLDGAQDVVFVLDRSGSMGGVTAGIAGSSVGMSKGEAFAAALGATLVNGATGNHLPTKLAAAKAELIHTLRALPDGTRFNVIWFDDEIAVTARRMLVLEPGSRAAIEHFISGIEPGGSTAAVPALELAYRMGAARVVLLSDGLANTGGGGEELLSRARGEMQRGVRFDTVGLGIDQDGELLQRLAAESGGVAMMR
jgi:Mg-chelatase subunit ChlD